MASDIWLRTILIVRKETRCHHIIMLLFPINSKGSLMVTTVDTQNRLGNGISLQHYCRNKRDTLKNVVLSVTLRQINKYTDTRARRMLMARRVEEDSNIFLLIKMKLEQFAVKRERVPHYFYGFKVSDFGKGPLR